MRTHDSDGLIRDGGITLVMPVFNRRYIIKDTLDCISKQSRRPEEVILVDNGSTDGSYDLLFEWKEKMENEGWKVRIMREKMKGASRARQTGFEAVKTEYVMFFDSDDRMDSDHLESIMRAFSADPELDLAVWPVEYSFAGGRSRKRRILKGKEWENHFIQGLLSTQAYAVRSDFLRKCGGWNPSLGGWDDWELGIRLLLNHPSMHIGHSGRVHVLQHEDSITGTDFGHRKGDWEKTLDTVEAEVREFYNSDDFICRYPDMPELRHLLTLIAYRRINLAGHYYNEGLKEEAEQLFMKATSCGKIRKPAIFLLRLAYHYVGRGLPFAGAIFPHLMRNRFFML